MSLPTLPKKELRPVVGTFRLTKSAVEYLKVLAKAHGLSQATIVDMLIKQEYKEYVAKHREPKKSKK